MYETTISIPIGLDDALYGLFGRHRRGARGLRLRAQMETAAQKHQGYVPDRVLHAAEAPRPSCGFGAAESSGGTGPIGCARRSPTRKGTARMPYVPSDIFHAAADGVNFVNPAALFAPRCFSPPARTQMRAIPWVVLLKRWRWVVVIY